MLLSKRAISAPTQITITQKQYVYVCVYLIVLDGDRKVANTGDLFLYPHPPNPPFFLPSNISHAFYQLTSNSDVVSYVHLLVLTNSWGRYLQSSAGLISKTLILSNSCCGLLDNDGLLKVGWGGNIPYFRHKPYRQTYTVMVSFNFAPCT